jgi:hypothetical protein
MLQLRGDSRAAVAADRHFVTPQPQLHKRFMNEVLKIKSNFYN